MAPLHYDFRSVPLGIYAVSVIHDANNDGKLNTTFGIPTEGLRLLAQSRRSEDARAALRRRRRSTTSSADRAAQDEVYAVMTGGKRTQWRVVLNSLAAGARRRCPINKEMHMRNLVMVALLAGSHMAVPPLPSQRDPLPRPGPCSTARLPARWSRGSTAQSGPIRIMMAGSMATPTTANIMPVPRPGPRSRCRRSTMPTNRTGERG